MGSDGPTGPTVATLKRLFALSGNQCAFPKCTAPLIDGSTVVGKVCHIKASSPGGPRYDPSQTAEERHGYANLVCMCGRHADVIDDDEDSYRVERLQRIKADHEQRHSTGMSDSVTENGARLLFISQSVASANQSGGITAHTVNIHNYGDTQKRDRDSNGTTVSARDGAARFRAPDQPLGTFWDLMPFSSAFGYEVFLSKGPAIWLRLMPSDSPEREWLHDDLLKCGRSHNVLLQPLAEWVGLQYLRAEDGIAAYTVINPLERETETRSVAFAFKSGEVWCIDTSVLHYSRGNAVDVISIARTVLSRLRRLGDFLTCLGLSSPFRWIAGVEGVKGWLLKTPPPPNHVSTSVGEPFLTNVVSAEGTYDIQQPSAQALLPFFNQLYRKCGVKIPEHIDALLRQNRTF